MIRDAAAGDGMRACMAIPGAACVSGGTIGSMMVYIAIDHNPQGEFVNHETGAVNYAGLSEIFLSWFVVVTLAAGLVLTLMVWAARGLRALYRLLGAQISS
jgi:hypothetical protein